MMQDLAEIRAALPPASKPHHVLPANICDTHGHVLARREDCDLAPGRAAPVAPVEIYSAVHDAVGAPRGVLIQAAAYAFNNAALLAALAYAPDRLRGVAVPAADTPERDLEAMASKGVRGVRFIRQTGLLAERLAGCVLDFAHLESFAPKLKALGWHANVWAPVDILVETTPILAKLGVPIVIDHMGSFDPTRGVRDPAFQSLLSFAADHECWVKLCPIRNSKDKPAYEPVRPFHDAWLEKIPDRLMWCSDWPFLGLDADPPDLGHLLDLFFEWTPDAALRRKILVDNPARLYGFDP